MNKNMLALKVYDVDYSFIIKNYLNEKLWEKEWTIFIYKNFHITLRLDSISVRDRKIWFKVKITDNGEAYIDDYGKDVSDTFSYNLSIENIEILKQSLNHTIFQLMQKLENQYYIQKTSRYYELCDMKDSERQRLQEIAETFLDNENVTNEEIREAYIEYYVDKSEKVWNLRNDYEINMKYKMITDLYLIFLKATKDEDRIKIVKSNLNTEELDRTLQEIKEYEEYMETEEFEDDMQSKLEDI